MDNWDEIRTAYHVAKLGTVSAAAHVLGVHHATVIRHIDALEANLGVKLFHRHARGYAPTEAGQDLLTIAQATDDQFSQLAARIKGRGEEVTGELIVTSLPAISTLLIPVIEDFQKQHPKLIVRLLTSARLFRLEYGEAHLAIRAGPKPTDDDNVVQHLSDQVGAIYASNRYKETYGLPKSEEDAKNHRFVCYDDPNSRAPFDMWVRRNIPAEQIVFQSSDQSVLKEAILEGIGIGYLPLWGLKADDRVEQVFPPRAEWSAKLWLVTHVDLHRSLKVQTFAKALKNAAKSWPSLR